MKKVSEWSRDAYEGSITRMCFSWTPYDAGWDGDAASNIDGKTLQQDAEMQRLLELEVGIRPVRLWARKIAAQINDLAPCGWCFPQFVEAVCKNMGAADPAAAVPCGCYNVGQRRLDLMSDYALCLDAWLKRVPYDTAAAELLQRASDQRDWARIAESIWDVLGTPTAVKALLVRRLLARLRFWLRAPFGALKADDNPRLGYFYSHSMGRYGGWDYFSFHHHDPELIELDERVRTELDRPDRWLTLIDSTWPCAPKAFRYLERILIAIGRIHEGSDTAPAELQTPLQGGILEVDRTYLDSDASRRLFETSICVLGDFVRGSFPGRSADRSNIDAGFASRLVGLLDEPSAEKLWLAAVLLKRITLFDESFKSYHFTRNAQQVL